MSKYNDKAINVGDIVSLKENISIDQLRRAMFDSYVHNAVIISKNCKVSHIVINNGKEVWMRFEASPYAYPANCFRKVV